MERVVTLDSSPFYTPRGSRPPVGDWRFSQIPADRGSIDGPSPEFKGNKLIGRKDQGDIAEYLPRKKPQIKLKRKHR